MKGTLLRGQRREKCSTPGGIRTHDLSVTRRVVHICANTITANLSLKLFWETTECFFHVCAENVKKLRWFDPRCSVKILGVLGSNPAQAAAEKQRHKSRSSIKNMTRSWRNNCPSAIKCKLENIWTFAAAVEQPPPSPSCEHLLRERLTSNRKKIVRKLFKLKISSNRCSLVSCWARVLELQISPVDAH